MKSYKIIFSCLLFLSGGIISAFQQSYNPLSLPDGFKTNTIDLTVHDSARQRDMPIRVYLPQSTEPAPVVIFSHGLGGSREMYVYLGKHWSARGYLCVFVQHPGSDDSVWKNKLPFQRLISLKKAANLQNFLLRVKDVSAVIDQLEVWNKTENGPLFNRMDLNNIGMAGHSFGAVTTQAVSGEIFQNGKISFTDKRIKAAIAMSPSAATKGNNPETAFGSVNIPWLLMTGTKDVAPVGNQTAESRLEVFPYLPSRNKYQLVLNNAEHSAFTDRPLPGDKEQRNPNHHKVILALSTAFWDAYLKSDQSAKEWLNGSGPSSILQKDDRLQLK